MSRHRTEEALIRMYESKIVELRNKRMRREFEKKVKAIDTKRNIEIKKAANMLRHRGYVVYRKNWVPRVRNKSGSFKRRVR